MKKNLILLLILLSCFTYAQKYSFDFEISIEERDLKGKQQSINQRILFNSKNSNYRMFINENGFAELSDDKKQKHIKLKIDIDRQTNEKTVTYVGSRIYTVQKNIFTKAKKIRDNNFLIQSYYQKNKKKSILEINFTLEEASANLLYMDGDIGDDHKKILYDTLLASLDSTKNYVIKKKVVNYKHGSISEYNLKKIEKTELSFVLPE